MYVSFCLVACFWLLNGSSFQSQKSVLGRRKEKKERKAASWLVFVSRLGAKGNEEVSTSFWFASVYWYALLGRLWRFEQILAPDHGNLRLFGKD